MISYNPKGEIAQKACSIAIKHLMEVQQAPRRRDTHIAPPTVHISLGSFSLLLETAA
jgi:hypothetical protein